MSKAIIYARQSSGDDEISASVELQISRLREIAAAKGLAVAGVYSDLNTSGRTYPAGAEGLAALDCQYQHWYAQQTRTRKFRPGLGAALAEIAGGAIDNLLIYDLTRLYRPVTGSFLESYISQRLAGIRIITTNGDIDLANFSDGLVSALTNRINDDQLIRTRQKSMAMLDKLKREGIKASGVALFGYWYDKNTRSFRVIEEELRLVRMAFDLLLAGGYSIAGLCRELEKAGERRWWPVCLIKTFRHPEYCGMMRLKDGTLIDLAPGQYERYPIAKGEWFAAQDRIAPKRFHSHARKYIYALSGLMRCGYCGRSMVINMVAGPTCKVRVDRSVERITRVYCPKSGDNSCGAALTRYSARPPIPIGTPSALPTPPAGSWRARMQRLVARAGDDYAVSPQVQGIAEAIMPLLAVACMEDIALVRTSNAAARLAQARNALQEISLRRGKLLDLLAKGLAPAEDIAERIAALKSEEDSLQAEIPRLAAAAANGSENALQQAYARLLAIRRGTLHPTIFRELFLRLYRGITIYAGTVVLHRRRGGDIFLEKYHQRQLCGMPPSTFRLEAFPEGGYKAEVTYYYASYFKGDETPHLIYIDDKIKVVALGYNYPYGYPRTPGAVRRKQAIAREKELLHPPVPGDAEPPADGS